MYNNADSSRLCSSGITPRSSIIYSNSIDFNCIRCSSFNCRGFNESKHSYVNRILSHCDFLCLQEHWLPNSDLFKLNNLNSNFLSTGVSGFDDGTILNGRPYGGCAILWRANIDARISLVEVNSKRMCAIRVERGTFKLLVVNVYMPHMGIEHYLDVFQEELSTLDHVLCCNSDCHLVLCGDFNVDFDRNNIGYYVLSDFCRQFNLHFADNHLSYSVDYSYNFNMQRFSTLDHFILSSTLFDSCLIQCCVQHDGDNISDHDPLFLHLNVSLPVLHTNTKIHKDGLSWAKATPEHIAHYSQQLSTLLHNIHVPQSLLHCVNPCCSDATHLQNITNYCNDITKACLKASSSSIPKIGHNGGNKSRIPGWTEWVEPVREKSILWHDIWQGAGRPHNGLIADIMRRTRAAYHYAIRKVKRNECDIRKQKFAECIAGNRTRDFWTEIKRMNGTLHGRGCAATVDGISDTGQIASLFADKYQDLYNSVPYDQNEMLGICNKLNERIGHDCYDDHSVITEDEIATAILNLKFNKKDGSSDLSTNHLKYAGPIINYHLSILLSSILVHGFLPADLCRGTTIPIPKGNHANLTVSDNYRGITLCSTFLRIFDMIVLSRYSDCLSTCDLQFGFKRKSSTNMCTWLLKETASYYVNNNSSVYCTMLDASKAFDKIEYCSLFKELIKRNLPAIVVRALINVYCNQKVRVVWNNNFSEWFSIVNGVKQGAIISPILFCVYFDNLLLELQRVGVGCYIGRWFIGALAYADDVALLAPTPSALRRLIAVCENYAAKFHVTFNAAKSKCIFISKKRRTIDSLPVFTLNGNLIEYVDSWPHLGHIVNSKLSDDDDVMNRRRVMFGQINRMICNFKSLGFSLKCKLFNIYCSSHYGCELWDLGCHKMSDYCAGWRRGLRRLLDLPFDFSSSLLHLLSHSCPVVEIISCRFLNFVITCYNSDSELLGSISRFCVHFAGSSSVLNRNIVNLSLSLGTPLRKLLTTKHFPNFSSFAASIGPVGRQLAQSAQEIVLIKEGVLGVEGQLWDHAGLQSCLRSVSDSLR